MCVKYFVLIFWWLTIFNKCIFEVANVGRSLAFIERDGFYRYFVMAWTQWYSLLIGHVKMSNNLCT